MKMPSSGGRGFSAAEAVVPFSPHFHQCLGKKLCKLNVVRTAVGLGSDYPRDQGLHYTWLRVFAEKPNACPGNGLGDALLKPDQWRVSAIEIGLLHECIYTDGNRARRMAPTL